MKNKMAKPNFVKNLVCSFVTIIMPNCQKNQWRERMTNLIPSCPQCENRLFSIYVGGFKERIDGEMWCKVCKKITEGSSEDKLYLT